MTKIIGAAIGIIAAAVAVWIFLPAGTSISTATAEEIVVYKTAQCGCCAKWVDHMRASGFEVTTHDVERLDGIKSERGVPSHLSSCHTAVVQGYTVEGHVPADVVRRLLRERPPIKGIAVPGMPAGSPGMESAIKQPYSVISFDAQGRSVVYENR